MSTSSVTQKGQVTVPVDMRKALGLTTGSKVRFSRLGRKIFLESVKEAPVESLFGTFRAAKGQGVPDIDAAIEQVRGARSSVRRVHKARPRTKRA